MNFGFSEEQNLLRAQVVRFMQENCPLPTVREIAGSASTFAPSLWKQMAELGWLGLITPESLGGVGLKWVDLTVVLEETGRGLCPLPLASHMLATAAVLRCASQAQQGEWLPAMASGAAVCTIALHDDPSWIDPEAVSLTASRGSNGVTLTGTKPFVPAALSADYLLLACRLDGGLALVALGRDQVESRPQPTMDTTKPTSSVTLNNVTLADEFVLPMTAEDLAYLTDLGAVAIAAEMAGAAQSALTMTSDYARERIQFGKPIGQYQGVKHRLADMYVDVESLKSLTYYAAWTVDDAPEELPRAVSLAKGYGSDAFARIGIDGVGLHGAIGFTAEYDVQLYLKRSKWSRPAYGDSDYHLERVAALGGL